MIKFGCDVCGKEVDASDVKIVAIESSEGSKTQNADFVKDVCPTCMDKVYDSLNISEQDRTQIFLKD